VIVKMTRHEGDLHHPDILRKLLQYDTWLSYGISTESKASDYQENTYRDGFQINQDNTSVQKVGGFSQKFCRNFAAVHKNRCTRTGMYQVCFGIFLWLDEVMIHDFAYSTSLIHLGNNTCMRNIHADSRNLTNSS
jgi:hypothetical protein